MTTTGNVRAQRPGYLPWLCNHRSDQSRDSTTAEGMSTARLLRRRRPEARRWIKDDSCAKLVSMELLFQTKSYSFVCVSLFDFIRPRLSPSLLHPSYHLRFLLIHSYFTFFRLEDFSDHFPILTTNKLNGKTSGPHWELDWPFALCSGMSMLRIQQYSSPAGLMDAWEKRFDAHLLVVTLENTVHAVSWQKATAHVLLYKVYV